MQNHFQLHFLEWNCLNLDFFKKITEIYSYGANLQYSSIDLDNGLVSIRRQAIIWTNDGQVCWRIYASLGLNELMSIRPSGTHISQLLIII